MTLQVNEPTDQRLVSELASYIRENRLAINSIVSTGNVGSTTLTVALGSTSLAVGAEIGTYGFESIIISGDGISTLIGISGGTEGQIKEFIFQGTNVRMTDGNVKSGGLFYLNQLPAGTDFNPQQDDIIALINIGGDGASIGGYWKELYRTLSIK